jgi:hypothetical protein
VLGSDRIELQLNIVGVVGYSTSFRFGKGVIIMETFLEILREVLKGIMREIIAYFFRINVLENKKTTPRRTKEGTEKVPLKRQNPLYYSGVFAFFHL